MAILGQIACYLLLGFFAVLSWVLPRRFGNDGMLAAQLAVGAGFFGIEAISLSTQPDATYAGGLSLLGLLIDAFLFNCLMLPIVAAALWRRRRCGRVRRRVAAQQDT